MASDSPDDFIRDSYSLDDIRHVETALEQHGTLTFARLSNGLFPAAAVYGADRVSGYQYVWSRDNVYIGWAHLVAGRVKEACDVARALLTFYSTHRNRFEAIISGDVNAEDVSQRPHVRFDGETLAEIDSERWAHAQNDALGYVLWYCTNLLRQRAFEGNRQDWETLALFPKYLEAIRYWEDQDSGHWEEARKLSASSIGVVIAGLEAWLRLLHESRLQRPDFISHDDLVGSAVDLLARGRHVLEQILPSECTQPLRSQNRRYDSALLFLVYPLRVVSETMERQILDDCERYLRGEIGFRRYLGDSYWAPDYDVKLPPEDRTRDFSNDMEARDRLLPSIGQEAQWCIFDSIVSAHFGDRYKRDGNERDRERQTEYLNRALRQLTTDEQNPAWRCPELYYLKGGVYAPNPHVPLQWAQGNLIIALRSMWETAQLPVRQHRLNGSIGNESPERGRIESAERAWIKISHVHHPKGYIKRPLSESLLCAESANAFVTPASSDGKAESVVGKLREEIVESQKARTELTKWKAILIAAIGAAALGLGEKTDGKGAPGILLLFGLLPLACLYVDILCIHNDIRMMVIGYFLRRKAPPSSDVSAYEEFCDRFRTIFRLENFALTGTTILISALVAAVGFTAPPGNSPFGLSPDQTKDLLVMSSSAVLAASGLLFLWKTTRLKDLAEDKLRPHWTMFQSIGLWLSGLGVAATVVAYWVAAAHNRSPHLVAQEMAICTASLILLSSLVGIRKEERAKASDPLSSETPVAPPRPPQRGAMG